MITSIHTLIYSDDAKATRAFLWDVLGWQYVAEDWPHKSRRSTRLEEWNYGICDILSP